MMKKVIKTACPRDCLSGCTINVHIEDGKIVKVEGGEGNKATFGTLCAKGMRFKDYVYSSDRLKYPMMRVGQRGEGKFKRVSWESAVQKICDKLNEVKEKSGPLGLMHYTSGGCKGMLNNYNKGFFSQFGGYSTKKGNLCNTAGIEGVELTYGDVKHNAPWDLENAGLIIMWGKNPAHTNVHEMRYINNAIAKGCRLVTIDPIKTSSALKSHLHISPKPNTDMALALCIINLMIQRESIDIDFINKYTNGFEALKRHVAGYSASKVSNICKITEYEILEVVELIEKSKPMTLICGLGIQRYKNGGQTVRAISMISALTGDIGCRGGGFRFANKQWRNKLMWPFMPEDRFVTRDYPASQLAEAIEGHSDPRISMLWIERANPLVMHPDVNSLKKALDGLDFIVVVEQFMTDTARYADVLLPAQSFFEYSDIFTADWAPYINLFQKAIDPYFEAKNESEIYRMLGEFMGYDMDYLPIYNEEAINTILGESRINVNVEVLKEGPYMGSDMEVAFEDRKFNTPSGKIELYSESMLQKWGQSSLPDFYNESTGLESEHYPLRFLSIHAKGRIHSQFADIEGLEGNKPIIHINSKDACERSISDGDRVEVFNDRGHIYAYVKITDDIKNGVVNIYPGLSERTGASVNILTAQGVSDIGWGATYHDCFVEVRRC